MPQTILSSTITPGDVAPRLNDQAGIRLIDVRTAGEFESVHIPGAYNVPLDTLGEHAGEISLLSDVTIVLVCQSGGRARKADESLKAAGMNNIHLMDGGMNAWIACGLPVVRGAKRMSLERQVRIAAGSLAAVGGILALTLNPLFAFLPALIGSGLVFAGVTDTCAMGMLLAKLKYNRPATCDPAAVVSALVAGRENPAARTGTGTFAASSCCSN